MKNPWTKKNPLMSMWLSGANSIMNRARGQATAAGKREANAMATGGAGEVLGFWSKMLGGGRKATTAAAVTAAPAAVPTKKKASASSTVAAKRPTARKTAKGAKSVKTARARKKR